MHVGLTYITVFMSSFWKLLQDHSVTIMQRCQISAIIVELEVTSHHCLSKF